MIKQPIKMKRPHFIIFVDKDGTINLEDKKLNDIFKLISSKNGIIIPTTGRTVGDISEDLKGNKLINPPLLIGDNGGSIYSTKSKEFIYKQSLDIEKVRQAICHFINIGGNSEMVRLTDGELIYAINNPDVHNYYKKKHTIKYGKNLDALLETMPAITKITFAGSKEQMENMSEYVKALNFWSDIGATKFPTPSHQHYRLDVADRNISKGNAVKTVISSLKPQYGYMCIGNGENDVSMFKQAINDNMIIGIMQDSPKSIIDEMKAYSNSNKKGRIIIIPNNINKANDYLFRLTKLFLQKIRTSQFSPTKNKGKKYRDSLKFTPPPLKPNHKNTAGNYKSKSQNVK